MVNVAVDKRRAAQPARRRGGSSARITSTSPRAAVIPVANGERWSNLLCSLVVVGRNRGELNNPAGGKKGRARRRTKEAAKRRRYRGE